MECSSSYSILPCTRNIYILLDVTYIQTIYFFPSDFQFYKKEERASERGSLFISFYFFYFFRIYFKIFHCVNSLVVIQLNMDSRQNGFHRRERHINIFLEYALHILHTFFMLICECEYELDICRHIKLSRDFLFLKKMV